MNEHLIHFSPHLSRTQHSFWIFFFLKTIQLHAERRGELVGLDFITFHFSWVVTQHDRKEGKVLTKDFKRFSRSYPGDYFH